MFSAESEGDFSKTIKSLKRLSKSSYNSILESAAKRGVAALASATPVRSGKTAASWGYEIESTPESTTITWTNSNIQNGVPIAIILQYGHGTGTGGYVSGTDYINPAMRPIFDSISKQVEGVIKG